MGLRRGVCVVLMCAGVPAGLVCRGGAPPSANPSPEAKQRPHRTLCDGATRGTRWWGNERLKTVAHKRCEALALVPVWRVARPTVGHGAGRPGTSRIGL